jgi:hypothetical protein
MTGNAGEKPSGAKAIQAARDFVAETESRPVSPAWAAKRSIEAVETGKTAKQLTDELQQLKSRIEEVEKAGGEYWANLELALADLVEKGNGLAALEYGKYLCAGPNDYNYEEAARVLKIAFGKGFKEATFPLAYCLLREESSLFAEAFKDECESNGAGFNTSEVLGYR